LSDPEVLTTYSETAGCAEAGSDPPITEATMTPPQSRDPASAGRSHRLMAVGDGRRAGVGVGMGVPPGVWLHRLDGLGSPR
jgi:hypothetical protein